MAAVLVELRPEGAKLSMLCFALGAAAFFFAGAFLAVCEELPEKIIVNRSNRFSTKNSMRTRELPRDSSVSSLSAALAPRYCRHRRQTEFLLQNPTGERISLRNDNPTTISLAMTYDKFLALLAFCRRFLRSCGGLISFGSFLGWRLHELV